MGEVGGAFEKRLLVHWFPNRTDLNLMPFHRFHEQLAAFAGVRSSQREAGQPAGCQVASGFWHPSEAGNIGQCLAVPLENRSALLHPLLQHAQLASSNTGQHIAHAVVEAHIPVFVVTRRLPGLSGQLAGAGDEGRIV